ncbi:Hypothetical predicted protein [Lecanosticta acicola]|uniref:Uncharacterized protein n=1 Tax=Lecanosticta acicola TaxID=111012 RepID=A0AAI8YZ66_9PEZI|nr:Hypothetical predicted protein [Lecanosticta acicola]
MSNNAFNVLAEKSGAVPRASAVASAPTNTGHNEGTSYSISAEEAESFDTVAASAKKEKQPAPPPVVAKEVEYVPFVHTINSTGESTVTWFEKKQPQTIKKHDVADDGEKTLVLKNRKVKQQQKKNNK